MLYKLLTVLLHWATRLSVFHQPFWVDGTGRHSPEWVGLCHSSCLMVRDCSRPLLISQTGYLVKSYPKPGLGIPLPLYSRGSFHASYFQPRDSQLLVVTSPSSQMGHEGILHTWFGCDAAPCVSGGIPGRSAGKTLYLQICTLPSSRVRIYCWLDSTDEQSCRLGLLLGHYRYEFRLPRSMYRWLRAPSPFSVTVGFPVAGPPTPCGMR